MHMLFRKKVRSRFLKSRFLQDRNELSFIRSDRPAEEKEYLFVNGSPDQRARDVRGNLTIIHDIAYCLGFARGFLEGLVGLVLVTTLSACGGGGSESGDSDFNKKPIVPPAVLTTFDRLGLDVQLFGDTAFDSTGTQLGATLDSSANITFKNSEPRLQDHPNFNYNFTFPSGLTGGFVKGNLYTLIKGAVRKEITMLTPSATKTVQNVFWRNSDDPTLFGFGLAGHVLKLSAHNWPKNGKATYVGKAFQYIVDSNVEFPAKTTYALFSSDVTASVDYPAKTIAIAVAPNSASPTFISAIGDPAVINADPHQFSTSYTLTSLDLSGNNFSQFISEVQPQSGFGLSEKENGLSFYGNNAEELAGFIRYNGDINLSSGLKTRDQFISFALIKQ